MVFHIFLKPLHCSKWKQPLKGVPLNRYSQKIKYLWKSSCSCSFFKYFSKIESYLFLYFQGITLFLWIKIRRFLKQKIEHFGPNKIKFYFLIGKKIRTMASNRHFDLRKIVNVVRSKGKTANFWKPCKSFKTVDEILTCKGKRWVIFDW